MCGVGGGRFDNTHIELCNIIMMSFTPRLPFHSPIELPIPFRSILLLLTSHPHHMYSYANGDLFAELSFDV